MTKRITKKSVDHVAAAMLKANKFPGPCVACGSRVDAGEGVVAGVRKSGAWAVEHREPCLAAAVR